MVAMKKQAAEAEVASFVEAEEACGDLVSVRFEGTPMTLGIVRGRLVFELAGDGVPCYACAERSACALVCMSRERDLYLAVCAEHLMRPVSFHACDECSAGLDAPKCTCCAEKVFEEMGDCC